MFLFVGLIFIVGYFQVIGKYFYQYLFVINIDVLLFLGFCISQMFEKIELNISVYLVIVLYVGVNDLLRGLLIDIMFWEFQDFIKCIWNFKLMVYIVFFGVFLRGRNQFLGVILIELFFLDYNQRVYYFNYLLVIILKIFYQLYYIGYISFMIYGQIKWELLSRDGLYLSRRGISCVVFNIERVFQYMDFFFLLVFLFIFLLVLLFVLLFVYL